jgi:mannosyltransferase OCH1-like enzyme
MKNKKIYKIWVGPKPIPDIFKKYTDTWSLISNAEIIEIGNEYIEQVKDSYAVQWALLNHNYAVLNHYIRYHLLYHHGGIYMDLDVEVIRDSMTWWCYDLQIGMEMPNWANNHVMICNRKDNPFFAQCMTAMNCMPYDQMDQVELNTGPRLVTRILQAGGFTPYELENEVQCRYGSVHPERVFSPHRWNEAYHPSEITPDTLAVHHFCHSWKPE